jgi:monofunctional biosynthetic peptidoglycan transglycosylase
MIFDFRQPDAADRWRATNDVVMGGVSEGGARRTDDGTLMFSGVVSLENNGGFASIRSDPAEQDLSPRAGLSIRVRGDGKRYAFNLRTNVRIAAGSYQVRFDTQAGEWQELFFPFGDFQATSFGRPARNVPPLDPARIQSFGFTISDKQVGRFQLEVDWIKAAGQPVAQARPAGADEPFARRAQQLIELAITRGAPLFNAGNHEACASIYEVTATSLLMLGSHELSAEAGAALTAALDEASRSRDSTARAWTLRHALDDCFESLSKTAQNE